MHHGCQVRPDARARAIPGADAVAKQGVVSIGRGSSTAFGSRRAKRGSRAHPRSSIVHMCATLVHRANGGGPGRSFRLRGPFSGAFRHGVRVDRHSRTASRRYRASRRRSPPRSLAGGRSTGIGRSAGNGTERRRPWAGYRRQAAAVPTAPIVPNSGRERGASRLRARRIAYHQITGNRRPVRADHEP
jgi:hypothetical protein